MRQPASACGLRTSFNAHTLKASADGSIVITLPPGLTIIFYSHKASEASSIVCTNAAGIVRTII
jgi:hypothetical protein